MSDGGAATITSLTSPRPYGIMPLGDKQAQPLRCLGDPLVTILSSKLEQELARVNHLLWIHLGNKLTQVWYPAVFLDLPLCPVTFLDELVGDLEG